MKKSTWKKVITISVTALVAVTAGMLGTTIYFKNQPAPAVTTVQIVEEIKAGKMSLAAIPVEERSYDLCKKALENDAENLAFIPPEKLNLELALVAVKANPEVVQKLPESITSSKEFLQLALDNPKIISQLKFSDISKMDYTGDKLEEILQKDVTLLYGMTVDINVTPALKDGESTELMILARPVAAKRFPNTVVLCVKHNVYCFECDSSGKITGSAPFFRCENNQNIAKPDALKIKDYHNALKISGHEFDHKVMLAVESFEKQIKDAQVEPEENVEFSDEPVLDEENADINEKH